VTRPVSATIPHLTRIDWRIAIVGALLVLGITAVPYLVGYLTTPPGLEYGGFIFYADDYNSYLAKMHQGAEGSWVYQIPYTVQEHDGGAVYLFYLALGHLAAATGLSLVAVWHLARWACGLIFLPTVYAFLATFLRHRAQRKVAYLLVCFSAGIGWVFPLLGFPTLGDTTPLDLWVVEGYAFLSTLTFPHFALASALLVATVALGGAAIRQGRLRTGIWAGLLGLALVAVQPYNIVTVAGVLGGYWLLLATVRRRIPWRGLTALVLVGLLPLPLVLYDLYVFAVDPVYRAWAQGNQCPSPNPLHYLIAYGLLWPLALAGLWYYARRRARRRDEHKLLVVAWLVCGTLLLYAPVDFQRRLVQGLQIPLCILATEGLLRYLLPAIGRSRWVGVLAQASRSRYDRSSLRRFALNGMLLFCSATSLALWSIANAQVLAHSFPFYHEVGENQALDWLATRTARSDAVLASYEEANYVPARAGNRVYAGHWAETPGIRAKMQALDTFYDAQTSDDWRETFLAQNRIRYLVQGPRERALGAFDPAGKSYLIQRFSANEFTVYKVQFRMLER